MTTYSFDATVVIGRFQPFHKGHLRLIRTAMELSPLTFVLLGSSNVSRTPKHVWTVEERISMMQPCFTEAELKHLHCLGIEDYPTDEEWLNNIQTKLSSYMPQKARVGLIGYMKDESSYYLHLFKKWSMIHAPKFCEGLSATDLREAYFHGSPPDPTYLPDPVVEFLCDFRKTVAYKKVKTLIESEMTRPQKA